MFSQKPSTAAPVLAALWIVALPLAAYTAGYLWLCEYRDMGNYIFRIYDQPWQASFFGPAAWVESKARRIDVYALDADVPVSW